MERGCQGMEPMQKRSLQVHLHMRLHTPRHWCVADGHMGVHISRHGSHAHMHVTVDKQTSICYMRFRHSWWHLNSLTGA